MSTHQPINPPFLHINTSHQPINVINLSTHQPFSPSINQHINPSTHQPISPSPATDQRITPTQ
jgi:hypothetical protein